jgi:hypothetical protein
MGMISGRTPKNEKTAIVALLVLLAAAALSAFQFGDRRNLNSMPFAQVQPFVSDLPKAQKIAAAGNIELFAGEPIQGKSLSLRGEITDANCFLANHRHAYDHAFCAKLCAAAGSPLVFIPDQGAQIYVILTPQNAVLISNSALDQIGIPGILVNGKLLDSSGLPALALESIGN